MEVPQERYIHSVLAVIILGLICVLAVSVRLFSVIKYESVIHEFDPYFNYRSTQYAIEHGLVEFLNWFDDLVWYPVGRHVGHTVYPGLMITASAIYNTAKTVFHIEGLEVRNVCVFMAPVFAAFTSIATFLLGREIYGTGAGLLSAFFISIVPGYISRSVAGSYDNEAIAIFALVFTFYSFVKALNSGSILWGGVCAIAYYYMVLAWGGYIYIVNLIPAYAWGLLLIGRYSASLYMAYSIWYVIGTLLAMQVPFVGFNVVFGASGTHYASHAVFVALQINAVVNFIRGSMSAQQYRRLLFVIVMSLLGLGSVVGAVIYTGLVEAKTTTRFMQLLDPNSDKIPILSSVSEHQSSSWPSMFFDLHYLLFFAPIGAFSCFRRRSDACLFILAYGLTSAYFAAIMIRLVLVLAPSVCVLSGIGVSDALTRIFVWSWFGTKEQDSKARVTEKAAEDTKGSAEATPDAPAAPKGGWRKLRLLWAFIRILFRFAMGIAVVALIGLILVAFIHHSVWISNEGYSNPSIVMWGGHGAHRKLIDDFREAYFWLRMNTKPDAKIMSWWDYGYQTTAMANRASIVDNNTWNNTHIATVGRAMASTETNAYPILRKLDVDYVFVLFGGYIGYSSDDINKFAWMVKISNGVFPKHVSEQAFGHMSPSQHSTKTMLSSLMYKMSYYRFGDVHMSYDRPGGTDAMRGEIAWKKFPLQYVKEAFTSQHWLMRIYEVKKDPNRAPVPATHYMP